MNKQGNTYTILYSVVLVLIVGVVLAVTYMMLKPKQDENIANDKRVQILSAVHIPVFPGEKVSTVYDRYITDSFVVNCAGEKVPGDAFTINPAGEIKKPVGERRLPIFVCDIDNEVKYIVPVYGAGLWGPIWGYVALDSDGDTVYGAYFSHSSETPGLGAEIATSTFQKQFEGKKIYMNGAFRSIDVMKAGQHPHDGAEYVNAISGGTITSKGVQSMLADCLSCYDAFFNNLRKESSK